MPADQEIGLFPPAGRTRGVCPDVFYTHSMADLGKMLVFVGLILAVAGLGIILLGRTNLPLGRLPGDFLIRGKNSTFYFPLVTSILLSVVLSAVLYIIGRFRK